MEKRKKNERKKWSVSMNARGRKGGNKVRIQKLKEKRREGKARCYILNLSAPCAERVGRTYPRRTSSHSENTHFTRQLQLVLCGRLIPTETADRINELN